MRKIEDNLNKTGVYFADSGSIDAFSRARVSNPANVFDCQFTYDLHPLLYEPLTTGSGLIEYDRTNRNAHMTLTNAQIGDSVFMQQFEHNRYQPGRSQLVFITFNLHTDEGDVQGVTKIASYSDGVNGFEFRVRNGVPEFAIVTSTDAGEQVATQSEWNLNRFDGRDVYVPTLDTTKTQIMVLDFQALYVGRVSFGFDINGSIFYCHEFNNANVQVHPYIATANLPVRVGMIATEAGVNATMNFICNAIQSEGGSDTSIGYGFSTEQEVTVSNVTDTHIVSIQPTLLFNGFTNRIRFELDTVDYIVKGNNPVVFRTVIGQALTDEVVTDVNPTYSGASKVTGTISGLPAIVINQSDVPATNQVKQSISRNLINRYPITLDASGAVRTMGRISVIARADNQPTLAKVILNWREVR